MIEREDRTRPPRRYGAAFARILPGDVLVRPGDGRAIARVITVENVEFIFRRARRFRFAIVVEALEGADG